MLTSSSIKERALIEGFDLCGIAPVDDVTELSFLPAWLAQGYAGRMTYLNRTAKTRADVRRWLPTAQSVVAVACLYNTDRPYSTEVADPDTALIARYAWGDDYHLVMEERLELLLAWMRDASPEPFDARIGVDTGPVQERAYAARAGIGWIGKNTCVIHPDIGSWLLLGVMATSLPLTADAPMFDQCGTCRLCIDACPTGAIVEPHVLDARRCLSYLSIEVKGSIPVGQRPDLGRHVFGCDICQDVCPYNAAAPRTATAAWQPRPAFDRRPLAELWALPDRDLDAALTGTALVRRGVAGVRRNLAVTLANAGTAGTAVALAEPPSDADAPSLRDPIVAEHLAWARGRRS